MTKMKEKAASYLLESRTYFKNCFGLIGNKFNVYCKNIQEYLKETKNKINAFRVSVLVPFLFSKHHLVIEKFESLKKNIYKKFQDYKENIKVFFKQPKNQKRALGGTLAVLVMVIGIGLFTHSITAYEVSFSQIPMGVVKDKDDVLDVLGKINTVVKEKYDADVNISEDQIVFTKVYGLNQETMGKAEVLKGFTELDSLKATAYQIVVNGKTVATLRTKKEAQGILDGIKGKYTAAKTETSVLEEVDFVEDVKIAKAEAKITELQSVEQAQAFISNGFLENKVHIIQSGETLSEIAKLYGMKTSEIVSINPQINVKALKIGAEVNLLTPTPFINIKTTETVTYMASIPYEIIYENTNARYKGETKVKLEGVNGTKQVVAKIEKQNGVQTSSTELSATVLSNPTSQVVIVGTKELPPLVGTGTYIKPTRGKLTSRFGIRWGRLHRGIDIGAATGTPIYAADGGTVISSEYDKSGYGYMIEIDHGGGVKTLYAHCSKLLVSKGDKVYQGQEIGAVGSTGSSTGPHLHFEVNVLGTVKNPLNYVSY